MDLAAYVPVAFMFLLVMAFAAVTLVLSKLVSPNKPTPEKLAPYECGIIPEVEPVQRFPVKFYVVAMLFVAWAVNFRELGWFGVASVGIFTLLVLETLGYVWKRGALDWNVPRRARQVPRTIEEEAA